MMTVIFVIKIKEWFLVAGCFHFLPPMDQLDRVRKLEVWNDLECNDSWIWLYSLNHSITIYHVPVYVRKNGSVEVFVQQLRDSCTVGTNKSLTK